MALRFKFPWRRPKGLPGSTPSISFKTMRRWAAYGLVGLVAFVAMVWLNLPTRAIAWRLADEAKRRGYLITIGELDVSPLGAVTLEDVTWNFTPTRPDEIAVPFVVDELEIDVSWWSLLSGDIDVEVEAQLDEGSFAARVDWREDAAEIKLDIESVPLYSLPRLQQSVNAPVAGTFSTHVELVAPDRQFEHANGIINLVCSGCTVGDGEELVFIPGAKGWLAKGITLPELRLGELNGQLIVTDGVALAEEFQSESEDLTLVVGGKIQFNDPVQRSRFDLEIKLRVNDRLQEENDSVRLLLSTASSNTKMEGDMAGWLGFRLEGSAARPRFRGINSKRREDRVREAREQRRDREAERRRRALARKKGRDDDKDDATDDGDDKGVKRGGRAGPDAIPEQGGAPDNEADARERERELEEEQRKREEDEKREDEEKREQEEREERAREEQERAVKEAEEEREREEAERNAKQDKEEEESAEEESAEEEHDEGGNKDDEEDNDEGEQGSEDGDEGKPSDDDDDKNDGEDGGSKSGED